MHPEHQGQDGKNNYGTRLARIALVYSSYLDDQLPLDHHQKSWCSYTKQQKHTRYIYITVNGFS